MAIDFGDLVKKKMEEENLSLRTAGKQAGVAHTTIDRVIKGESVDLSTMEKISQWVGIAVSDALDMKNKEEGIKGEIATLIALNPEFEEVFSAIASEIAKGNLSTDILIELTGFASYRLQKYREKKTG